MENRLNTYYIKATILAVWISICIPSYAIANPPTSLSKSTNPEVRHLLYIYHTESPLSALADINAYAELVPGLKSNPAVNLMLAKLYLDLGHLAQAQSLVQATPKSLELEAYKNEILLKLASELYNQQLFNQSKTVLKQINNNLSRKLQEKRQLQEGMTHLALKDYRSASKAFDKISNKSTSGAYAQYNLGIALLNRKKFDDGIETLDKLGQNNFTSDELKNLKDQTNLSLGFLYMRAQEPDLARKYLQRIRLSSTLSNQALLGLGLAESIDNNNREALIPLLELHDRPAFDHAVIESYLAVPHALAKLGSDNNALKYYELAVALFEQQISATTNLSTQLQKTPQYISEIHQLPKYSKSNPTEVLLARLESTLIGNATYSITSRSYTKLRTLKAEMPEWKKDYSDHTNAVELPVEKNALDSRIDTLNKQIDKAIAQHETILSEIVLAELQKENNRLSNHLNKVRFSMAQIYDRILNQRIAP